MNRQSPEKIATPNIKGKKKANSNDGEKFDFCEVCRRNHNQGRRHNFFPNHKKSLSAALARFRTKLSDIRFFLRNPIRLRPEHASLNRLWCLFCASDVLELDSSFACGNAITHLSSSEHLERVKAFLWKYGGKDKADTFSISEADFVKWEKKCNSLKTEATSEASRGRLIGPLNAMRHVKYLVQNYLELLKSPPFYMVHVLATMLHWELLHQRV